MANRVRFGIIGSTGLIGNHHVNVLLKGEGPYALAALCDLHRERLKEQCDRLHLPGTTKIADLVRRDDVDAIIVATPHPLHAQHVLAAVQAGKHVICEKPLAASPADARQMLKAIRRSRRIAAVHYQHRGRPAVVRTRQLIREGALGKLLAIRVTGSYYKTDYYYSLGGWRGTWRDEGGGVLMNQAPHDIDLMCYLAAQDAPEELVGRWTNQYHRTSQVEDSAGAIGRFPNGVEFALNVSVATHSDKARIEIFGSAGAITLLGNEFARYVRYEQDLNEFCRKYDGPNPYAGPEAKELPLPKVGAFDESLVHKTFAKAVLTGDKSKLLVPAEEAIWSAETIYAVLLSGHLRRAVKLPVSNASYAKMLSTLIAHAPRVRRVKKESRKGMSAVFY